ncbi:hypothetical protein V1525DRAFT_376609 [Lipomyces kononenkoae]|uniref:Uncharacterized protein n=1 Tax=Lipomyces kononenkoae TaxID=34357 RepID=A0ACC3T1J7_LIPKO
MKASQALARLRKRLSSYYSVRSRRRILVAALTMLSIIVVSVFRSSHNLSSQDRGSKASVLTEPTNNYIPSFAWETPFSFSVSSAGSDVAVLPQLHDRCPVYIFYDPQLAAAAGRNTTTEERLIAVWRQAFWALGFKPTILDQSHAKRNPLYKSINEMNLDGQSKIDVMRFLAWSTSPTGILTTNRVVPMTTWPKENTWQFWRSCQFGPLTTYKDTGSGFIIGSQPAVDDFVTRSFTDASKAKIASATSNRFQVEPRTDFLAQYSPDFVASNYKKLSEDKLPDLINAHLHSTFLSRFSQGGIAVLDPFPQSARAIAFPSLAMATALATCPAVEFERYCPSNIPNCYKCSKSLRKDFVKTVSAIADSPSTFVIVTIPHPMTSVALSQSASDVNADVVRRETGRDLFVRTVTSEIIGQGVGPPYRALALKKLAAASTEFLDAMYISVFESQFGFENCLVNDYFRWAVGFNFGPRLGKNRKQEHTFDTVVQEIGMCLPAELYTQIQTESARTLDPKVADGGGRSTPPMSVSDTITAIRDRIHSTHPDRKRQLRMVEAWNMADAELWRFVRALNERAAQDENAWE